MGADANLMSRVAQPSHTGGGAGLMSRCHCHAAPLLSVTLKGRAVVIEWHLVTTPWGATGDSKTMSGTGTLRPHPPLCGLGGSGFSPGLTSVELESF